MKSSTGIVIEHLPTGHSLVETEDGQFAVATVLEIGVQVVVKYYPQDQFATIGSSGILVATFRHHVELAAVKQDAKSIVCKAPEASRSGLNGLNSAV